MVRNRTRVTVHGEGTPSLRLRLNLNPQRYCSVSELCEVISTELQSALGRRVTIPPGTNLFFRSNRGLTSTSHANTNAANNTNTSSTTAAKDGGQATLQQQYPGALGVQLANTSINDASRARRINMAFGAANALMKNGNKANTSNTTAMNTTTTIGQKTIGGTNNTTTINASGQDADRRDADYFADFVLVKDTGLISDGDEILIDEWQVIADKAAEQEREEGKMRNLQGGFASVGGVGSGGGGANNTNGSSSLSAASPSTAAANNNANMVAKAQQQLIAARTAASALNNNASSSSALVPFGGFQQHGVGGGGGFSSLTTLASEVVVFDLFNAASSDLLDNTGGPTSAATVSSFSTHRMSHQHILMTQKLIRELMAYHIKVVMFLSSQCSKEAEIAAHDIHIAQGQHTALAEALIDEVTLGARISDPAAAMRAATQLAAQRGKEEREFSDGIEAEKIRQLASVYRQRIVRLEEELKSAEAAVDDLQQQLITRELSSEQTIQQLRAEVKRLEEQSKDAVDRVWTLERVNAQLQKQHREVSALNERLFQEANTSLTNAAMAALHDPLAIGNPNNNTSANAIARRPSSSSFALGSGGDVTSLPPPALSGLSGGSSLRGHLSHRPLSPTSAATIKDSKGAATQVARRVEEERFHNALTRSSKNDAKALLEASLQGQQQTSLSFTSPRLKALGSIGGGGLGIASSSFSNNINANNGTSASPFDVSFGQQSLGMGGNNATAFSPLISPTSFAESTKNGASGGGRVLPPVAGSGSGSTTAPPVITNRLHWPTRDATHMESQQAANADRSKPLHPKSLIPTLAPTAGDSTKRATSSLSPAPLSSTALVPKSVESLQTGNVPSATSNAILQVHIATATGATHSVRFEIPRKNNSDAAPRTVANSPLMSLLLAAMPKVQIVSGGRSTNINQTIGAGGVGGTSDVASPARGGDLSLAAPSPTFTTSATTLPATSLFSVSAMQQQQLQLQHQMQAFYVKDLSNLILQGAHNAMSSRLDPSASFIAFYAQIMYRIRMWQASSGNNITNAMRRGTTAAGADLVGLGAGGNGGDGMSTVSNAGGGGGGDTDEIHALLNSFAASGVLGTGATGRNGGADASLFSSSSMSHQNSGGNSKGHAAKDRTPSVLCVLPALPSGVENDIAIRPDPNDPSTAFLVFFRIYYVRNGQRFPIVSDSDLQTFLAPSRGPVYTCNCIEIADAPTELLSAMVRRGEVSPSVGQALMSGRIEGGGGVLLDTTTATASMTAGGGANAKNGHVSDLVSFNNRAASNWSAALTSTGTGPVNTSTLLLGGGGDGNASSMSPHANANSNTITAATIAIAGGVGMIDPSRSGVIIDEYGIPIGVVDKQGGNNNAATTTTTTTGGTIRGGRGGGEDASMATTAAGGGRRPFFKPRRAYGATAASGNTANSSNANNTTTGGQGAGDGNEGGQQGPDGGANNAHATPTANKAGGGGDAGAAGGTSDDTRQALDANGNPIIVDGGGAAGDGGEAIADLKAPLFSGQPSNNLFLHASVVEVPSEVRLRRVYQQLHLLTSPLPQDLIDMLHHEREVKFKAQQRQQAKMGGGGDKQSQAARYVPEEDNFFAAGSDGDEANINLFAVGMRTDHLEAALAAVGTNVMGGNTTTNNTTPKDPFSKGAAFNNNNNANNNGSNAPNGTNSTTAGKGGKGDGATTSAGNNNDADLLSDDAANEAAEINQIEEMRRRRVTVSHVLRYLFQQYDAMGDVMHFWRLAESVLQTHGIQNGSTGGAFAPGGSGNTNGNIVPPLSGLENLGEGNAAKKNGGGGDGRKDGADGTANGDKNKKNGATASGGAGDGKASLSALMSGAGGAAGAANNGVLAHNGNRRRGVDTLRPIKLHTSVTFANFVLIVLKLLRE